MLHSKRLVTRPVLVWVTTLWPVVRRPGPVPWSRGGVGLLAPRTPLDTGHGRDYSNRPFEFLSSRVGTDLPVSGVPRSVQPEGPESSKDLWNRTRLADRRDEDLTCPSTLHTRLDG